jgi:heme-degrading monooxygenase HmoA/ketosteroid isomerase-like protein
MQDRRLIVFRSRLREGVSEAYGPHAERIYTRALDMPGFVSAKDFSADDGERLALIEWEGADALEAWRVLPEHRAAQEQGRASYYAEYRLDVCEITRTSSFDGKQWNRGEDLRSIATRWLDCFARRDLDGLLALYADDATHTSPKIRTRHPETGGLLRGKAAMRAWWQDSFDRLPSMRYEPTALTADGRRVFMEYVRHVDGEAPYPVAEVLQCADGKIVASRVFHG